MNFIIIVLKDSRCYIQFGCSWSYQLVQSDPWDVGLWSQHQLAGWNGHSGLFRSLDWTLLNSEHLVCQLPGSRWWSVILGCLLSPRGDPPVSSRWCWLCTSETFWPWCALSSSCRHGQWARLWYLELLGGSACPIVEAGARLWPLRLVLVVPVRLGRQGFYPALRSCKWALQKSVVDGTARLQKLQGLDCGTFCWAGMWLFPSKSNTPVPEQCSLPIRRSHFLALVWDLERYFGFQSILKCNLELPYSFQFFWDLAS